LNQPAQTQFGFIVWGKQNSKSRFIVWEWDYLQKLSEGDVVDLLLARSCRPVIAGRVFVDDEEESETLSIFHYLQWRPAELPAFLWMCAVGLKTPRTPSMPHRTAA